MINYINCTLIVQIINFWVTYFILRTLLFNPILELINDKQEVKDSMLAALIDKENAIDALREKKEAQHAILHKQLDMVTDLELPQTPSLHLDTYTPKTSQELKESITQTKEWLVKNVPHHY
ncbi:MAG: hypothetical protein H6679_03470 [Epsilonproteobacteria bacterium]|nr:hypothetical protein [Campylobacterota bacterium]